MQKKHSLTLKSITNKGTFECNNIVEAEVHTRPYLSITIKLSYKHKLGHGLHYKIAYKGFQRLDAKL